MATMTQDSASPVTVQSLRRVIRWAKPVENVDQSVIKNVLEAAITRAGASIRPFGPAQWGWGVYAVHGGKEPRRIRGMAFGSADPMMALALSRVTPDILRASAREARWTLPDADMVDEAVPNLALPMIALPVTPVRVLTNPRTGRRLAMLTVDVDWAAALNRTMAFRFGRPFALRVMVDPATLVGASYLGQRAVVSHGHVVKLPGVVHPIILMGPPADLATVWTSGMGASTGMGFGWIDDGTTAESEGEE